MEHVNFAQFIQLSITLFFVFNALGMIPAFVSLLARYERSRQRIITIRELIVAFITLCFFVFFGLQVLDKIRVAPYTIDLAGGVLLFLIALQLIFPKEEHSETPPKHEPLIIPLAIPGLAGPGSIAAMIAYSQTYGTLITIGALFVAWLPSLLLLLAASYIKKFLGKKGMEAVEKIGGMIISLIGINMLTEGVIKVVNTRF